MYLPVQSEPVQRTIAAQPPSALAGRSGPPSGYGGVEPSGWFDDIVSAVKGVGQVATTVAPYAGQLAGLFGI
jgi:hypothetical protein